VLHDILAKSQTAAVGSLPLLQLRGIRGGGRTVDFVAGGSSYNEKDLITPLVQGLLRAGVLPPEIYVLARISHAARNLILLC